jgi:hypothetical protein
MEWALHLNEAGSKDSRGRVREHDNLHVHVIFSERSRVETDIPQVYNRDVYYTAEGKQATSKKHGAKDADGNALPPVHRKGDLKPGVSVFHDRESGKMIYGTFSAKDSRYKSKEWQHSMKRDVKAKLVAMGARDIPRQPIKQYKEGKGSDSGKIREKNEVIRETNAQLAAMKSEGLNIAGTVELSKQALRERKLPVVAKIDGQWMRGAVETARQALVTMRQTVRNIARSGKPPENRPDTADSATRSDPQPATAAAIGSKPLLNQGFVLQNEEQRILTPQPTAAEVGLEIFKNALHDLERLRGEIAPLRVKTDRKGNFKGKDAARCAELDTHGRRAWNTLVNGGVSAYDNGIQHDWRGLNMKDVKHRASHVIAELGSRIAQERRFVSKASITELIAETRQRAEKSPQKNRSAPTKKKPHDLEY